MIFDTGFIIATINLIVGIVILFFSSTTVKRLKGSALYWVSILFALTGTLFVVHAGVEVFGIGEDLYGLTALVATILLAFTMIIINITLGLTGATS